jgi:predicted RNase H-like HicB family nuclease
MRTYSVLVWKDDDKYYVAKNLALDIVSQWTTPEEAIENLKEATELFLEDKQEKQLEDSKKSFFLTTLALTNG